MFAKNRCLAAAMLIGVGAAAHAETPLDLRPQLSVMYSHVFEDSARGSEEGMGAYLGAGWNLGPAWGLELGAFLHNFDDDVDSNGTPREWREYGANLDALYHFSRNPRFSPYARIGAGAVRLDERLGDTQSTDPFAHVGLGFKSLIGEHFGLRGDVGYRYIDVSDKHAVRRSGFSEPTVRLGFFVPFGAAPVAAAPAAAPQPPPPVATPAAPAPEPVLEVIYEINETVLFEFDSAVLRAEARPSLMTAAKMINDDTTLRRVEVGGHTCDLGSVAYNVGLSERRARAVRDFLVNEGNVDPAKLSVRGYGKAKPKVANDSIENRKRNRRVEIGVLERQ